MAVRQEILERPPLSNVEIEYEPGASARGGRRPRFNRARLLDIDKKGLELGSREAFADGYPVALTMHLKGVQDYLKVEGKVTGCKRVTILRQPAFAVAVVFVKPSDDQVKKIAWAESQLAPRRKTAAPIRVEVEHTPSSAVTAPAEPEDAPPAAPAAAAAPVTSRPAAAEVKRPVSLLQLIDKLDKFEVTNDLVLAILEAAEAGLDVEVLYQRGPGREADASEDEVEETDQPELAQGEAKPLPVYRLARNARLHFSDAGMPVGPAAELIYASRIKSPGTCFAMELGLDTMTPDGVSGFKPGTILIFSTLIMAESGEFAFVRLRTGQEFGQVFADASDKDAVRLRFLNPKYPEQMLRRRDVLGMHKLIGQYTEWAVNQA